jgi:hypothetical protein
MTIHDITRLIVLLAGKSTAQEFSWAVFFLSYRKLRFHTIRKAPRGCALGARVDGCRSNRASARECATAHSFFEGQKRFLPEGAFGRNQYGLEKYREFSD